jgi:hypothetical protein
MIEKPRADVDTSVQREVLKPKFPTVLSLRKNTAKPSGPKKNVEFGQVATAAGLSFLMRDIPVPELGVLAISAIEVGVQTLPVDGGTVEALKDAFSIDGQVVPVPVRKHQDGRHELISGYADIRQHPALGKLSKLYDPLDVHFQQSKHEYQTDKLYHIDVTPISRGTMADYALKAFKNGRVSYDDIRVF